MRLYFFNKFQMLKKPYGLASHLMSFQSTKFDKKVNAVKDSEEKNSNVIEEYQVFQLTNYRHLLNTYNMLMSYM